MSEHKELTCNICKKMFKHKQGFEYHNQNKVCVKSTCEFCERRFKSSLGLKYHISNRICLPTDKIKIHVVPKYSYSKYTFDRSKLKLREVMDITPNFGMAIFNSDNIVIKFCELTLCNDKLDQYWGYYINNKGSQFINVYQNDVWILKPQTETFRQLSDWAMEQIYKYLCDNKSFVNKDYWTKYFMTKDNLNSDHHPIKTDIRQKLFCMFVNHKSKINLKKNS